jgi:hypothetical protein
MQIASVLDDLCAVRSDRAAMRCTDRKECSGALLYSSTGDTLYCIESAVHADRVAGNDDHADEYNGLY